MILKQYTIVCQVPDAEAYTICAYSGTDLSKVLGITQAKSLNVGNYGWIQICGEVKVKGRRQTAYIDVSPNNPKLRADKQNNRKTNSTDLIAQERAERLSKLPPLLIENGQYCKLLREARDVFVDGHFYACVAMCGISFERFQRDKAKPFGVNKKHKMWEVREILKKNNVLSKRGFNLCKKMADLRNKYAHGSGRKAKEDALKSLDWIHSFIKKETDLMRIYIIVDGMLQKNNKNG